MDKACECYELREGSIPLCSSPSRERYQPASLFNPIPASNWMGHTLVSSYLDI